MTTRPDELEAFKTEINLSELMASFGYQLDRKASSRNSASMVHPDGDKLIVARGRDGHWVYFSVRDPGDNGTVIDFVQRRTGENLGHTRRRLRDWLRSPITAGSPRPDPQAYAVSLDPITRDLAQVRARFEEARPLTTHHPYLADDRRIPVELLSQPAFHDRVRVDPRGNVLFPHFTRDGVSGFEVKNAGFTGFAKGGTKGLWGSRKGENDNRLVIAETAIDALSHAVLAGHHRARFVSIAGELNPLQPELVTSAIASLPRGSLVVLAMDNDEGGDRIAEQLAQAFHRADRDDLELRDDRPPVRGTDWNDVLRTTTPPPLSPDQGPGVG
jgi:hypothetical protein